MRLTRFTDYSLRVLLYLGCKTNDDRATINNIATAYDISKNHLLKVVTNLANHNFIETSRGKTGGIKLAQLPKEINIGTVFRTTTDENSLIECFDIETNTCPIVYTCPLKGALHKAQDEFIKVLDQYTLEDVLVHPAKINIHSILMPDKKANLRL